MTPGLATTDRPLAEAYDLIALDLDGVVYVGGDGVPHAADSLDEARAAGARIAFVTNNAARPPARVADHLRELGVDCEDDDVVTSAQAGARLLAERLDAGARVFVIGGDGLFEALSDAGLTAVTSIEDDPEAVVSGYAPDLPWERVRDGAILVAQGLLWVATNTDATVPTRHGMGPGNGVLVGVVADFSGRDPLVAGKPERALLDETVRRVGGRSPLMVGDRVDTDIDGAVRAEMDSLLVLTGVTDLAGLLATVAGSRPSYVAPDLRGLLNPQPEVKVEISQTQGEARCGDVVVRWTAAEDGAGVLEVDGVADDDSGLPRICLLRASVGLAWGLVDAGHDLPDTQSVQERLGTDGADR